MRSIVREVLTYALRTQSASLSSALGLPVSETAELPGVDHAANRHLGPLQQERRFTHSQERAHR
ncbi:MAG TPA: hypothetical protein VEK37_08255 [Gemmatimonadaceae bacterium]|nr:hypothetical protein [Gemmatimonadaceae bacterium]